MKARRSPAPRVARLMAGLVAGVLTILVGAFATPAVAATGTASTAVRCATATPLPVAGIDMSASVVGPTTSPCTPTGTATPPASTPGSGTTGGRTTGGSSTSQPSTVAPAAVPPVLAADEIDLGGILNVGGLDAQFIPSPQPFAGELALSFTVRNVSDTTFDATADFWMEGPVGNRLGSVDGVEILALKPGESRTVSAEVGGVGQWTLITAHARLTPPDEVDGTGLTPLTRDATVFAPPWLLGALAVLAAAGWAVSAIIRRRADALHPVGVPA